MLRHQRSWDKKIPEYVSLYQSGKINLDKLLTHEYLIEDINRAFDDLENGEVGRALVKLQTHKRM